MADVPDIAAVLRATLEICRKWEPDHSSASDRKALANASDVERAMSPAKTNAERQREFRARHADQQATEVRGIFAHPDDHQAVKDEAAKINRRRARSVKKAAP